MKYLNTRRATKVGIVLLAVPFSLIGAFWLLVDYPADPDGHVARCG